MSVGRAVKDERVENLGLRFLTMLAMCAIAFVLLSLAAKLVGYWIAKLMPRRIEEIERQRRKRP
jgi:uncharacterized membrane protein YqjE